MIFAATLLLTGCDLLDEAREELDNLTNPLVGQVLVVGIDEPDDANVAAALEGTDWDMGVFAQVFLADATSADDLSKAPVGQATVKATVGANDPIRLEEIETGSYTATNADGLVYQVNANVEISVDLEGGAGILSNKLPAAPELNIPKQQSQNTALVVNLSGNYNAVLGVVVNAQNQNVIWSNEPTTPEEIYNFSRSTDIVETLEIPASAFSSPGVYAVGVAGLVNGNSDDYENVNSLLSGFMAGKMGLYPVTVLPN